MIPQPPPPTAVSRMATKVGAGWLLAGWMKDEGGRLLSSDDEGECCRRMKPKKMKQRRNMNFSRLVNHHVI